MIIDERELSEKLATNLPDGWSCRVFNVLSGSGKEYWVHILRNGRVIALCDCPDAKFNMPLVVLGVHRCKHADGVMQMIHAGKLNHREEETQ